MVVVVVVGGVWSRVCTHAVCVGVAADLGWRGGVGVCVGSDVHTSLKWMINSSRGAAIVTTHAVLCRVQRAVRSVSHATPRHGTVLELALPGTTSTPDATYFYVLFGS